MLKVSFYNACVKVKVTRSCPTLCDSLDFSAWNSPGQNTAVGSCCLLQGIFPTQGSNSGLLHCRQILYQLSHQGSPRIWEWVAYPFSRGLPDLRIEPGSPALQVDSLLTRYQGSSHNVCVILYNKNITLHFIDIFYKKEKYEVFYSVKEIEEHM